ncbi:MAG: S-layer homology domain-containing protein [Oscillospiraceae bacterium]|nr:S-layer homology domain-containing protein [Oscillospiraceae bacterium]
MRTRIKRALSWILVVCMILMLIPLSAATSTTLSSNSAQMVSANGSHTLLIRNDGTLWSWGLGLYGRLGDGDTSNHSRATPFPIPTPAGATLPWVYVSAGGLHSAAIDSAGVLWTWGAAGQGQLGSGTTTDSGTPAQVTDPNAANPWVSVSAGARHTVAIKADGTLWAWGENAQGAIGQGNVNSPGQYNTPQQIFVMPGIPDTYIWLDASAGGYYDGGLSYGGHTLAIRADGTLWAWGWNQSGQVGNGTITLGSPYGIGTPTNITPTGTTWSSVSAGCWSSFAIDSSGTLWGWGGNGQFQLGLGVTGDQSTPQQISTATDWQSVSAGRYHTMGIRSGTLWGWGQNDEGWLGNGTTATNQTPLQIGTDTNWIRVSAAWYHTMAVKNDGSLWSAGSNGALQLGNGNTNTGNAVYTLSLIQPSIAIVTEPANASVVSGQSASLSVTAVWSLTSGNATYQWYSTPDGTVASGTPITDGTGTGASFTTPALTDTTGLGTTYYFYVIVSDPNAGGASPVTSAVAAVTARQSETTISPVDLSTLTTGAAGAWGPGWSFDGTVLTIDAGATVSLTGAAPAGTRIVVQGTAPTNVTFDSVTIPDPGDGISAPLTLASGAVLNLTVTGTSSLISYSAAPAIAVPSNGTLNILGNGILNANNFGGSGGVGIGGSTPSGTLTMSGSPIVYASGVDMTLPLPASSSGILFNGTAGTVYGSLTTATDWTIPSGSTLDIPVGAALTVGAGTTLTNSGDIENNGTLNILGTLNNYNTINNNSGGTLAVAGTGTLVNDDLITNSGTVTIASGGQLDNWATITNNAAGTVTVDSGGELQNGTDGTINNNNILNVNGSLDNYGTLNNGTGSSAAAVTIGNGGTLTNTSFGTMDNGTNGTVTIVSGGTLTNANTLTNDGAIGNSGTLNNNAPSGTLTNTIDGSLTNSGTINNANSIVTTGNFGNTAIGLINNTGTGAITGATAPTFDITLSDNTTTLDSTTYTFPGVAESYPAVTPLTVTVTNSGNQVTSALAVTLSGGASSSFTINTATISSIPVDDGTNTGNNTATFTVVPNTGLAAGIYVGTVTVAGNNGATASFQVSFTVTTVGYSASLSQTGTYTFPGVAENYTTAPSLIATVANTGTGNTGALTVALSGANPTAFSVAPTSFPDIVVGANNTFTIAPNIGLAAGTYTATVTVSGDHGITASFDVSFTVAAATYGIALSDASTVPATALDGTTYTFSMQTVGYTATPLTVTVDNTGNQPTGALTVTLSEGASSNFSVTQITPVTSLAVSGTGTFTVAPNAGLTAGTYTETVTVTDSNQITTTFTVSFTVAAYGISLSQTGTYSFASAAEGYAPVTPLAITVTNIGNQPTGALTVALTSGANFTLGQTTISSIAVGDNDAFTVMPNDGLTAGVYTDTVTVLGGNGITATFNVSFTVSTAAYGITLSPNTTQNFGTLSVGYTTAPAARTITVHNIGNQPTGALTVALSGMNSGSFTLSTSSIGSIAASGSDSFTVAPNTGLAVGTYNATVTVSGGSNITAVSFPVSFTVAAATGPTPPSGPTPPHTPTPPSTPTPPPVPTLPFLDIAGHWAAIDGSIAFVYDRCLMRGTSATTFAPNDSLTRAMFVTILYRMAGEPEVAFNQAFSDIADGQWYSAAVVWAAQNGIVQGVGNGRFAPETAVSREQIAVFLHRYAAFRGYDASIPSLALHTIFSDYHLVSDWAKEAMAWAVENGLIVGFDGKSMPLDAATRAECAVLLRRFIGHYAD